MGGQDEDNREDVKAVSSLAVFYSMFSASLAAILCYFRHYLGGPGLAVFLFYWLQLVVLVGAIALDRRHYLSAFVVVLIASLLGALLPWTLYLLVPLSLGCLALLAIRLGRTGWPAVSAALAAMLLGLLYFFTINGMGYANVLLPERILTGLALPDTLFHTALSSILSQYGILASALNGFARLRYHAFSHLWFGLAARGEGLNAVHGYYLGLQIIILPLLLFGFSLVTSVVGDVRRDPLLLLAVPLLLLICFERFDANGHLVSESHATGLALLLIGIPFLRRLSDAGDRFPDRSAALALIFAILLSAAKISIGATWTIGVVYLLVRQRRLSPVGWLVSVLLLAFHAWVVMNYVLPSDNVGTTVWGPLDFPRSFPLVFAVNFIPVLLASLLYWRDWRNGRDRLWQETMLLMALVCVLPTLLLKAEGGAVYYFINIATWLALASLASRLIGWIEPYKRGFLPASVIAIAVIAVLTPGKLHAYGSLKYEREALFRQTDPQDVARYTHHQLFDPAALRALQRDMADSTGMHVARLLQQDGVEAGADMMVTVAPSFRAFWTLTPQCNVAQFLIPSYFGVPLLDGLPPEFEHCALGRYYGYSLYGREAEARLMDDAGLCRLARARGFHHVAVVETGERGHRIDCPPS